MFLGFFLPIIGDIFVPISSVPTSCDLICFSVNACFIYGNRIKASMTVAEKSFVVHIKNREQIFHKIKKKEIVLLHHKVG